MRTTTVRRTAWGALLLGAAIQGWMYRHDVSPDGVAYLDLSDAIVHGRPGDLINGYWSPVYPVVVGLLRLALAWTPVGTPYWEFTILHLASFIGFVLSLWAFEWFLDALTSAGTGWKQQPFALPLGRATAYAFFGVTSLYMISVRGTLPDFFLATATYAAFACLLRLRGRPSDGRIAVGLGAALAFGALTKSFFFPFAVVVLATLAMALWRHGSFRRVAEAFGVFATLTAPWVVALSLALGKPSTGETGALNYAWYVNGIQPHNSGVMPALAAPSVPLPLEGLAVFPSSRGTNPLWYDPTRWHRDIRPHFSVAQQLPRLWWSVRYYIYVTAPILLLVLAVALSAGWREVKATLGRTWIVLLPSLSAYGAYAMVYSTSRYVAPFLAASCLAMVAAFPWSANLRPARFGLTAGAVMLVVHLVAPLRGMETITSAFGLGMAGWLAFSRKSAAAGALAAVAGAAAALSIPAFSPGLRVVLPPLIGLALWRALRASRAAAQDAVGWTPELRALVVGGMIAWAAPAALFTATALVRLGSGPTDVHPEWRFASEVRKLGVAPGARVALLGNPENAGWARLMRVQVVAVVPEHRVEAFARLTAAEREQIMRVFAAAGATRLIVQPSRAALRDQ